MKKITSVLTLLALCAAPLLASAQSTADLQSQTQSLLQQVQQLQSQIAASNGTGSTSGAACPNIGRTLKLGSSGDDVTRLQQFLAADPSIYPEGTVTGYFGALTQTAVQRWQTKYNIVSSGSPSTTGFGVVGPRTAAAIALQCSQTGSSGSNPIVGGYIQVSPISGTAPLSVNVTAYANSTLSCSAVQYTLDFGDGTPQQILNVPAGGCQQVSQKYTHIYIYGGGYKITLAALGHQTTALVNVYGPTQPTGIGGLTPIAPVNPTYANTFTLSTTSGAAPFTVTFSAQSLDPNQQYGINFGDGSTNATLSSGISGQQVTHVYQNAGTFTAQLLVANNVVVQNATVVATSNATSGSYGIVSVTPTAGSNQIAIQLSVPACPTYTVLWGDGTTAAGVPQSGCSANTAPLTPTLNHIYGSTGSYTISLQDVNNVVQSTASITIQ